MTIKHNMFTCYSTLNIENKILLIIKKMQTQKYIKIIRPEKSLGNLIIEKNPT